MRTGQSWELVSLLGVGGVGTSRRNSSAGHQGGPTDEVVRLGHAAQQAGVEKPGPASLLLARTARQEAAFVAGRLGCCWVLWAAARRARELSAGRAWVRAGLL